MIYGRLRGFSRCKEVSDDYYTLVLEKELFQHGKGLRESK